MLTVRRKFEKMMVDCDQCGQKIRESLVMKMWNKDKRKFENLCQACMDKVKIETW